MHIGCSTTPPIWRCWVAVYLLAWVPVLPYNTLYYLEPKVDDVLCIIDKGYARWETLASDYKNNCYPTELELTEDGNTHFLECEIIPNGDSTFSYDKTIQNVWQMYDTKINKTVI